MCHHNGRNECAHCWVLDEHEIFRKKIELRDLLIEDACHVRCDSSLRLYDLLPNDPVDCLDGYTEDGTRKWKKISLKSTVDKYGNTILPLTNYFCHIKHSEGIRHLEET